MVGGVPIPTTGEKAEHSAYSVGFAYIGKRRLGGGGGVGDSQISIVFFTHKCSILIVIASGEIFPHV